MFWVGVDVINRNVATDRDQWLCSFDMRKGGKEKGGRYLYLQGKLVTDAWEGGRGWGG